MQMSRRNAFKFSGAVALGATASSLATGCNVAAVGGASAIFNANWVSSLTSSLGATLITAVGGDWYEDLSGAWQSWQAGGKAAYEEQRAAGWPFPDGQFFGASLPPASMYRCAKQNTGWDPKTDRLVVLVEGGAQRVVFDAWAWQGLSMFADDLTAGRTGDDLAAYRTLCSAALTPSGVAPTDNSTPSGRSQILSYQARSGSVELARTTDADGKIEVQVTTFGIPTGSDGPTVRSFVLPEETAPDL